MPVKNTKNQFLSGWKQSPSRGLLTFAELHQRKAGSTAIDLQEATMVYAWQNTAQKLFVKNCMASVLTNNIQIIFIFPN